ncbi:MAG: hypothetical protein AB7O57_03210 [Hyphomicrobiaceae bacterium]
MPAKADTLTNWPLALRWYLVASLAAHFAWEVLQLPLYTLWSTGTLRQKAFAVLHCTLGDVMIAGLAILVALSLFGRTAWPTAGTRRVYLANLMLGVGYTIYSEWLNVSVRGSWSYAELMPVIPLIGTGLTPFLQWIIVPTAALWIAVGRSPWRDQPGAA